MARFRRRKNRGGTCPELLSERRDRGGGSDIGRLSARGVLSAARRGRTAAAARHPRALAEGVIPAARAGRRGGGCAARIGVDRHAFVVFCAAQGATAGAESPDRGLRNQRLSVAANRRLSAVARR